MKNLSRVFHAYRTGREIWILFCRKVDKIWLATKIDKIRLLDVKKMQRKIKLLLSSVLTQTVYPFLM